MSRHHFGGSIGLFTGKVVVLTMTQSDGVDADGAWTPEALSARLGEFEAV